MKGGIPMKKWMSLFLCALLCMSILPACAETAPVIETPIAAADYELWFANCVHGIAGEDMEIAWVTSDGYDNVRMATINGTALGIIYIHQDGMLDEIAFTCTSALDETAFTMIQGLMMYTVAPVLDHECADPQATGALIGEGLMGAFADGSMLNQTADFCGVPCIMFVSQADETNYSFQFVMDFMQEEAAAE